jgi:two-component system, LytTR family, sensor kinase
MHNASFFIKYKLHHVLFWLLLFGLWFMLRYEGYVTPALAFKITFIKIVDLMLMVYTTNYLLIPFLLYKKRYVTFILIFIGMILTSSFTKMYIIGQVANDPTIFFGKNLKARIYDNVIPHFFLVIAGAAFKLVFDQLRLQKRIAELAKENAEAELNFLKSQINPHFLFNSLNSVYFLIDKSNPDARQALHTFSDMLRYQLYEANGEKIPIEKEINYLQDYVHLQQLRKDENYKVQFNCSPEVKNFSIEPLLLIPFVENAFKHISHKSNEANFVKVDLTRNNGYFEFAVENSREKGIYTTEQHGGIGMANVKRRLELLYPDTHKLDVSDEANTFKINLKLKI